MDYISSKGYPSSIKTLDPNYEKKKRERQKLQKSFASFVLMAVDKKTANQIIKSHQKHADKKVDQYQESIMLIFVPAADVLQKNLLKGKLQRIYQTWYNTLTETQLKENHIPNAKQIKIQHHIMSVLAGKLMRTYLQNCADQELLVLFTVNYCGFTLPGGKNEPDETPLRTVIREFEEEVYDIYSSDDDSLDKCVMCFKKLHSKNTITKAGKERGIHFFGCIFVD